MVYLLSLLLSLLGVPYAYRIEDYSKITPEALLGDITKWLGGLAKTSEDFVKLEPTRFSDISPENPFAGGRFHPMGKAAYGIPTIFRLSVIPVYGEFAHLRKFDGVNINVTESAKNSPGKYDFDQYGSRAYTEGIPFTDGVFIEVRPSEDEWGGFGATISTSESETHPTVGPSNHVTDSIHIPLRQLKEVRFEAVRLGGQLVQERTRL